MVFGADIFLQMNKVRKRLIALVANCKLQVRTGIWKTCVRALHPKTSRNIPVVNMHGQKTQSQKAWGASVRLCWEGLWRIWASAGRLGEDSVSAGCCTYWMLYDWAFQKILSMERDSNEGEVVMSEEIIAHLNQEKVFGIWCVAE